MISPYALRLHPCRLPDDDEGRPDAGVGFLVRGCAVEQVERGFPHHLAM